MYFSDFTRRPISKSFPEGENTNKLDTFTELKRQINELSRISPNVSWKKIYSLSEDILTNQSKDFRSACYFTTAAIHTQGLKGLVNGLSAIHDLTLVYWYSAYPEYTKEKARISAFEWMIEHTVKRQKRMTVNADDLILIEIGHRLTLKIEEELKSHYGIKAPSLGPIRRILSQWQEELKERQIEQHQQSKTRTINVEDIKSVINTNTITTPLPEVFVNETATNTPSIPGPKLLNSNKPIIISILILISSIYLGFKNYQQEQQLQTFKNANLDEFSSLIQKLTHSPKKTQRALKEIIFNKSTDFFKNWAEDPLKINKMDRLVSIITSLEEIYPDSITFQSIKGSFDNDRYNLINNYVGIKQQFNSARTIIANAQLTSLSPSVTKSYKFSNTLFPLLGRIEYAESSLKIDDINKAQYILNTYQFKINALLSERQ